MSSPILLILGAGNRVGLLTASYFAQRGYRIAVVSRSISAKENPGYLTINADLADPRTVGSVFTTVREKLGEPNVIIYNAVQWPRPMGHTLDIGPGLFQAALNVNHTSPVLAAQQSVNSFLTIGDSGPKVFLYTGNCLNQQVIPRYWAMGAAKSATSHMVIAAAEAYKNCGFRFHYVDERTDNGVAVYDDLDGDAHAKIFWELVNGPKAGPIVTFSKARGIVDFSVGGAKPSH